jgi:DNA helicase-2/ATP-dependent DNA helicase PcrA
MKDLEHLLAIASRYRSIRSFLNDLTLEPPASIADLTPPPQEYLTVSTIHSAKGLEWDAVFVIHAADGNVPSDMATGSTEELEEERRLFYVALTRAKDWLHVLYPLRYYVHPRSFSDSHGYAQPTRFVTPRVLQTMQSLSAAAYLDPEGAGQTDEADPIAFGGLTTEDIRRQLKSLF